MKTMKMIKAYKTSDGVVHEDLHRAARHALCDECTGDKDDDEVTQ